MFIRITRSRSKATARSFWSQKNCVCTLHEKCTIKQSLANLRAKRSFQLRCLKGRGECAAPQFGSAGESCRNPMQHHKQPVGVAATCHRTLWLSSSSSSELCSNQTSPFTHKSLVVVLPSTTPGYLSHDVIILLRIQSQVGLVLKSKNKTLSLHY